MTTLVLILGGIVVLVGFVVWLYTRGQKAGSEAVEASVAKAEVKAAHAANEAQVNAPRTPEAIDQRLRKGGGL